MSRPTTPDVGSPHSSASLQRRVGAYTLLIVALAVLVTGFGGYLAARYSLIGSIDNHLVTSSQVVGASLGTSPDAAAVARYVTTAPDLDGTQIVLVGADGRVFRPPGSVLPVDSDDVAIAAGRSPARGFVAEGSDGTDYRLLVEPLGTGFALVLGRTMATAQQILAALALAVAVSGLIAVIAAGLVARRVARAGLTPVRSLTDEVEERAAAEDFAPVSVSRTDEIGRLAIAFNHLLDAVQVSRTRQARFVADAGHELRTPLTSMRTNIELLSADTNRAMLRPEDRLTIMQDVRAQLVEFSDLVSDLIGLTREDRTAADFDEVDLTAVLEEAVDRVSMRAVGLQWVVDLEPTYLNGDADLLTRAFVNVLDNAVKFSPARGTITVTLKRGVVRIADEGRGVTPEERPFVFDRFFRSEASRATPGTGLGLSITESVVRQHGGTVAVNDAPSGGAAFLLTFPMAVVPRVTPARRPDQTAEV